MTAAEVRSAPIPHWPGEFVSVGDHQVFVRSVPSVSPAAPASAEPALCVHGLAGSSRNWTDLMGLLQPRLACRALDLPGYGESPPRPDGRYSIKALAGTVAGLIEALGEGPVHVIGNSMGGAIAVRVAARRPELVRTLTLVAPALPDARPRLDLIRFPVVCVPWLGGWLVGKYLRLPAERRVADVLRTCYCDPGLVEPERFAAEVAAEQARAALGYAPRALIGSMRALTAEQFRFPGLWHDATRVTVPTLVLYGSHDVLVSARMAARAARKFRGSRVLVLPRTGHIAQMEHPAAVAAEILALTTPVAGNSR